MIAAGRVQLPVIPIIISCAVVMMMMMMMTTTTAGCLSSLLPPPHVIIVTPDDGSFVPHWCNRHCWTFSDLSPNYTLRTRDEPIVHQERGVWINAAQQGIFCLLASDIFCCCCSPADKTYKISGKTREALKQLRDTLQTLKELVWLEVLGFIRG